MICGSRASSVGYNELTRDDGRMDRKRTLRCDSKYVHFLMFLLLDGKVTPKRWYRSCKKKFGCSQGLEAIATGVPFTFMPYEDGDGEQGEVCCILTNLEKANGIKYQIVVMFLFLAVDTGIT